MTVIIGIAVLAWLIAPVVLGVICIIQRGRIKELEARLGGKEYPPSAVAPREMDIPVQKPAQKPAAAVYVYNSPAGKAPAGEGNIGSPAEYPRAVPADKREKRGRPNTANVIMILGAMFIILAGFVFAAALWGGLDEFVRSVILLGFSAVFFGLSLISAKKLGLDTAGKVFYVIGSVFIPASFAALFGGIFSLPAVFSAMAGLLSAAFFTGAKLYGMKGFARTAYISLTAALSLLMISGGAGTARAAVTAALTIAALLAEPFAREKLYPFSAPVSEEYHTFAVTNTWALAAVSLFAADERGISLLPAVMYSAAFFISAARGKDKAAGMYPFCIYLALGAVTGIRPENVSGFVLIAAAVTAVFTVLALMDAIPAEMKKPLRIAAALFSGIVIITGIIAGIIGNADKSGPDWQALISAAAVTVQMIIICARTEGSGTRFLLPPALCWLAFEISRAAWEGDTAVTAMAAIMLACFIAIKLKPLKKRFCSISADITTLLTAAILLLAAEGYPCRTAIWLMLMAAVFVSGDKSAGRYALPAAAALSAFPLYAYADVFGGGHSFYYTFIAAAVIYCVIAAIVLIKPLRGYSVPMSLGIPLVSGTGFIMALISRGEDIPVWISLAAAAIYCGANLFACRGRGTVKLYSSYFLASVCLVCLTAGINTAEGLIFPAVLMLLMLGICIFTAPSFPKASDNISVFLWWAAPFYAAVLFIAANADDNAAYLITAAILAAGGCGTGVMRHNSLPSAVCMVIMHISVNVFLRGSEGVTGGTATLVMLGLTALSAGAGRLVYRDKVLCGADSDMLSVTAFAGAVQIFAGSGKYDVWTAFLTVGVLILNLVRKGTKPAHRRGILTAASLIIFPAWQAQPFFVPPEIIRTEFALLPAAIICVLIMRIHKDNPRPAENFCFGTAVISLVILFVSAVDTGYAADAVMLGIVIAAILLISFALRRKRWFTLAAASAAAEALALTLRLWNSRTWWIYLLAAGIVLIALGMANERKKQRGDTEKTGISRIMSDWKW